MYSILFYSIPVFHGTNLDETVETKLLVEELLAD